MSYLPESSYFPFTNARDVGLFFNDNNDTFISYLPLKSHYNFFVILYMWNAFSVVVICSIVNTGRNGFKWYLVEYAQG
jgi:hypothetical protein